MAEQQLAQVMAQMQAMQQQMQDMANRVQQRDGHIQELQVAAAAQAAAAAAAGGGAGQQQQTSLVQKWAPADFTGEHTSWRDWSIKFRSYMGALLRGEVGRWLEHVGDNRTLDAKVVTLGEASRAASTMLHGALIATCQGKALVIVQRAGTGEGLEAWRELLGKYEPRSKQSKVMRLCEVLGFNFKEGDLLDSLERFEACVAEYEKESGKVVDDDIKIGVVIRGIEKGSLREHLLLHSERTDTFAAFRAELDTIARAQSASLLTSSPMDIGAFEKEKFKGNCDKCGKPGHKKAECWGTGGQAKGKGEKSKGKGKGKGKTKSPDAQTKACFNCGMTNHFKADCRASPEKIKKFQEAKGKKSIKELTEEEETQGGGDFNGFDFCHLCAVTTALERTDETSRSITFTVDSAACRTVVPLDHPAARGYRVHKDSCTGQSYGAAKKGGPKIVDQGRRVLQTRVLGGEMPKRLNTRKADVAKPLLAVCDLVDHGHAVLFDSTGSYALNKKTGIKTAFQRNGKEWDLKMQLEAPDKANEVMGQIIAELRDLKEQAEGPAVILRLASDPEVDAENDNPWMQVGKKGSVREEPLFRLAVRR